MNSYLRRIAFLYIDFITGLFALLRSAAGALPGLFASVPLIEKLLVLFAFTGFFLTTRPWRHYTLDFSQTVSSRHGVGTDDFLWYFLLMAALATTPLLSLFKTLYRRDLLFLRRIVTTVSLLLMTLLYVLTVLYPSRIIPFEGASFTLWFYLFGVNLTVLWGIGLSTLRRS